MKRLVGTFDVPLQSPVFLRGNGETRSLRTTVDEFDVELKIAPNMDTRSKYKGQRLWAEGCLTLEVSVARDEEEAPPEPRMMPGGGRDWTARSPYFDARTPEYRRVAHKVVNNAIVYLKYELHQPFFVPIHENSQCFANPSWSDEEGTPMKGGTQGLIMTRTPGWEGEFGVQKLERKNLAGLARALSATRNPSLHEQILSDAQAAALEGNIRRAVLELAVACEVFVRETFLGSDEIAASVYEALEDKGKMNVRVLDLIEIGGAAVFGSGFRTHDPDAFADIDHMFRARNKSAHRGRVTYRDDSGVHEVTDTVLRKWWTSADQLFRWARGPLAKPLRKPLGTKAG